MHIRKFILFSCILLTGCNISHKEYYTNGKLKDVYYLKDGQRDSIYKEYDDKGNLKLEEFYRHGKLYGPVKGYYGNGKLSFQINFIDGLENGVYKKYMETGFLRESKTYIKGKLEGIKTLYFDNGKIEKTIPYYQGFPEGNGEEYFKTGQLKANSSYLDGELVYKLEFNELGDTIDEYRKLTIILSPEDFMDADTANEEKRISILKMDSIRVGKETGIDFCLEGPQVKKKSFSIVYVIYPKVSENKDKPSMGGERVVSNTEPFFKVPIEFIKEGTYIIKAIAVLNNKTFKGNKVIRVIK